MRFSPIERLLRRVPPLRYCVMQHKLQVRQKQRDAACKDAQSVLIAIGNIAIGWAGINLILNRFIEADRAERGPVFSNELPRNFTRKLDYLEKVERDPRWVEERLAAFKAFRPELAEMNTFRINLVHGLAARHGYAAK